MDPFRWLISSRYRRLCRVRSERRRKNLDRARRQYAAGMAWLWARYVTTKDYSEARRLLALIRFLEGH